MGFQISELRFPFLCFGCVNLRKGGLYWQLLSDLKAGLTPGLQ